MKVIKYVTIASLKYLLLLNLLVFFTCNQKHEKTKTNKELIVSLEKVISNCQINSDIQPPVPKLLFLLNFKNNNHSNVFIEMNNILNKNEKDVEFFVSVNMNGEKVKLPLYTNTGSNIYLSENTKEILSLVTYFRDIESIYQKKSSSICLFLNELLSNELTFTYRNTTLTKEIKKRYEKKYIKVSNFTANASDFIYELSPENTMY